MEKNESPRAYVDSLLACTSLMTQILDHMYRYPHSAPDAPPPPVVLANLLEGTLAPVFADRGAGLDDTTAVLEETAKTIEREIYLVAEPPPNRAERRRRRRQPPTSSCR